MDENREALDEVIQKELTELKNMEVGSDDHTKAVNDLAKLYQLRIDEKKTALAEMEKQADLKLREEQGAADSAIKEKQFRSERHGRIAKLIIDGAGVVVGALSIGVGANLFQKGLEFETTGTVTSSMFRNLLSRTTNLIFKK